MTFRIQADGLRDLIRDYKRAGGNLGKEVSKANKALDNGTDPVITIVYSSTDTAY